MHKIRLALMSDKQIEALLKEFGFPVFDNRIDAAKQRILDIFDTTYSTSALTDGFTQQEMIKAAVALGFQIIENTT